VLLLLACAAPVVPPGTDPDPDREDSGGADTAPTWVTLPAACEAPDTLPVDPLTLAGEARFTQDGGSGFLEALDIEVIGALAYVVGQGQLVVVDLSDPDAPQKVRGPSAPGNGKLHRVEGLATGYIATSQREQGVYLWDVADPAAPVIVGTIGGSGMEGLAYVHDRLYVGVRGEGVRVYDVSDPAAPVETGRAARLAGTWELAATNDGWLYAADASLGLVPIDVRSPDAPVIGTPYPFDAAALHARYADDRVFVALGGDGIAELDVTDRAAPALVTTLETGGSVVMTDVSDGRLWAVDHESVTVFDLSTGLSLQQDAVEQFALAIAASGDRAIVGDWNLVESWRYAGDDAPAVDFPAELRHDGSAGATLTNRGAAPLSLLGATATDPAVMIEADTSTLEPGASAVLRLSNITTDTTLCLATNDPDAPIATIEVRATAEAPAGVPAPDFALSDLDGQTWRLSEQLGQPVLLVYFATW
jgi:hypothetical protein